jgi:hypothetical protein
MFPMARHFAAWLMTAILLIGMNCACFSVPTPSPPIRAVATPDCCGACCSCCMSHKGPASQHQQPQPCQPRSADVAAELAAVPQATFSASIHVPVASFCAAPLDFVFAPQPVFRAFRVQSPAAPGLSTSLLRLHCALIV